MLLALLVSLTAEAGLFEPVRSRDPLPARSVERGPVVPMGWSTVDLTASRLSSGELRQRGLTLDLAHGLLRGVDGRIRLNHRTYDRRDLRTSGFAQPSFGLRGRVAERRIGGSWLAWDVSYRAPFGADHPNPSLGPAISEPNPRLVAGLVGRQRSGALRVELGVRGGADLPGVVGLGTPEPCADAWTSAVSRVTGTGVVDGWLDALFQAGPLFAEGGADVSAWGRRELVSLGEECRPSRAPLGGGRAIDARIGGGVQASRGLTFRVEGSLPVDESGAVRPVEHARGAAIRGGLEIAF